MTGLTKDQVLAELAELYRKDERQAGDVDKFDVARAVGCTDRNAEKIMKELERKGEFTAHTVRAENGHTITVWRRVGDSKL